jgi:hypothetical protein
MTGNAIFDRQNRCECFGILKKQRIVAAAQTQQSIEKRLNL